MKQKQTLMQWIWKSFLKTALIPLIVIELAFIGIYFLANDWSKSETVDMLKETVQEDLSRLSIQESNLIQNKINGITNTAKIYQQQTKIALNDRKFQPDAEDVQRLSYSPEGTYYSTKNRQDDGVAIFYSGYTPINQVEREKTNRLFAIQDLMKNIQKSDPMIASLYFNTFDSLNIIYPYFEVLEQYPPKMNIPSYNFYYEADLEHNPSKEVKWTDAYLDPAGHGWMASAIAPVYNKDFLEGVIGIDITIDTITKEVLDLEIPWNGYGVLIGKDGTILALPKQGEQTWGLKELKQHSYSEAIFQDTFKPDEFNIYKRDDLKTLGNHIKKEKDGLTAIKMGNENQFVSWSTIPATGWKLLVMVEEGNIYKDVNAMSSKLFQIGAFMIAGLLVFYVLFFLVLYRNSKAMSLNISTPLLTINSMVNRIGAGDYYQTAPNFSVIELEDTANQLAVMGSNFGDTTQRLDITREELSQREADLQALVNSIDDIIMKLDSKGTIINIWSNDEKNLYAPIEETIGKNVESIFDVEKVDRFMLAIQAVDQSKEPLTFEYFLQLPVGERWFQGRLSPILGEGRYEGYLSFTARDITERKEMERSLIIAKEEAEKASLAKSEFLSSMSHELRTPMNAILGFSQLLEMDDSEPLSESQRDSVQEISKAGNHLLTLINEVLELARIESGVMSVSIEPVEANSVLKEAVSLITPLATNRNISVQVHLQSCEGVYVKADRTKFKQVILNLMSNAVKYNNENGQILVDGTCDDNYLTVSITDTGKGMRPEELQVIFDPFYRIADSEHVEGTGIGLTVSKQLIDLMGGTISVESTEGVGSTFSITLPVDDSFELPDIPLEVVFTESEASTVDRDKKVILYIEDNPANLNLVERILEKEPGVELISAADGEAGLELAFLHRPDVILLDINLPKMNGFEVFNRLQAHDTTKEIPVIGISANAMKRDIEKGLSLGFTEYLPKPINIKQFTTILQKSLGL